MSRAGRFDDPIPALPGVAAPRIPLPLLPSPAEVAVVAEVVDLNKAPSDSASSMCVTA